MKKLSAVLLTLCMVLSFLPAAVFAEGETELTQTNLSSVYNYELPSGSYRLNGSIYLFRPIRISGNVTLDLNGKVLGVQDSYTVNTVVLTEGASLTINDSVGGGSIDHASSKYGVVVSNGSVVLNNGTLSYVRLNDNGSSFTINGGEVSNLQSSSDAVSAVFYADGGTVSGNVSFFGTIGHTAGVSRYTQFKADISNINVDRTNSPFVFTKQPQNSQVNPNNGRGSASWATNFTPVKLGSVNNGALTTITNPTIINTSFQASISEYKIRAWYGTGDNEYIDSNPFTVSCYVTLTFVNKAESYTDIFKAENISSTGKYQFIPYEQNPNGWTVPDGYKFSQWVVQGSDPPTAYKPGDKGQFIQNYTFYPEFNKIVDPKPVENLVYNGEEQLGAAIINDADNDNLPCFRFFNAGEGVTITNDGAKAKDAGTHSVTAQPYYGYCWPDGSISSKEITWTVAPAEYSFLEGANSKYNEGSGATLRFRADGPFAEFESLYIDGALVDSANYEKSEGSTIVVLSAAFMKTMKTGGHTLEMKWKGGSAKTSFTVVPKPETRPNPNTGVGK